MNKILYEKNPYFIVYINSRFSKCFKIVFFHVRHPTTFYVKNNHLVKHFKKYNESIIIWYGLWCKVFGISKVQYVMGTQKLFMKFIQCDHITCNIILLNPFDILFIYILFHGPWLIIQQAVTKLYTPLCVFSPKACKFFSWCIKASFRYTKKN